MNMSEYYDFREQVRTLYNNENNANPGDLFSSVLQIRDKNKCISSVNVSIENYNISMQFDDSTDYKKRDKIISKVKDAIHDYIEDNKLALNFTSLEQRKEFDNMLDMETSPYCDVSLVGNSVSFNL